MDLKKTGKSVLFNFICVILIFSQTIKTFLLSLLLIFIQRKEWERFRQLKLRVQFYLYDYCVTLFFGKFAFSSNKLRNLMLCEYKAA